MGGHCIALSSRRLSDVLACFLRSDVLVALLDTSLCLLSCWLVLLLVVRGLWIVLCVVMLCYCIIIERRGPQYYMYNYLHEY